MIQQQYIKKTKNKNTQKKKPHKKKKHSSLTFYLSFKSREFGLQKKKKNLAFFHATIVCFKIQ